MARVEYFWLDGNRFPIILSLQASKEIAERFESLDHLQDRLKGAGDDGDKIDCMCDILEILAKQGADYYNEFNKATYADAPINADGRFWYPTKKQIMLLASSRDIESITKALQRCIDDGQERKIGTKPPASASKKKKKHHSGATR